MASINLPFLLTISLMITFLHSSSGDVPPATPVSTGTACKSTMYYSFCKSVLPQTRAPSNVYDYGRFTVRRSLSTSRQFSSLINSYLRQRNSLTLPAVRALEDCQLLAGFNIDFLSHSFRTVDSTNSTLSIPKADDLQTLLSAILTNHQTCLDGLQATASAWRVKNGLSVPLSNNTKLYSVSLAFVTQGWVPKQKKRPWHHRRHRGRNHIGIHSDRLPLKMSSQNQRIYETRSSRRLLQVGDDQVLVNDIAVVSLDGTGNFTTINDAVAAAPNNTDGTAGYFLIYITAGVYEEYVSIAKNKKYLMMIGDGINQSIITGNRSVIDGWTTFNSATFTVTAPMFVAANITFRNTAGAIKHQAVAVRNSADLSAFYSCSFEAYQDTLYAHSLRQFYGNCDIYGTVDFIFGNAAAVFQNCNLYPRLPMKGQFNAITAQGRTDPNQNTGSCIQGCTIRAAEDLASSNDTTKTYLGRPWKEYSRTVYMQSFMDKSIDPTGWSIWSGDFGLNTSYYAEFNNTGPGSALDKRVNWIGYHVINATDAANFTAANFLAADVWLPQTGVPFVAGLM